MPDVLENTEHEEVEGSSTSREMRYAFLQFVAADGDDGATSRSRMHFHFNMRSSIIAAFAIVAVLIASANAAYVSTSAFSVRLNGVL